MARDLSSLKSYVRFYLTVTAQLEASWAEIGRAHGAIHDALAPHLDALASVPSAALAATRGPLPSPPAQALWKPSDGELSGLTDVYEVVGRFAFQGDDDENLARVEAQVTSARTTIHQLRTRVDELARLPELARATAGKLEADEARAIHERRAARRAELRPHAETLASRARQTSEAIRAVPPPDLYDLATAGESWARYATKMDQVWQTCLPYLQKALSSLYGLAELTPPTSWPEHLPLVSELPAELLAVPAADSPELAQAERAVRALDEEASALARAKDDGAAALTRYQGDLAAAGKLEEEARAAIDDRIRILDHAAAASEIDRATRAIAGYEQQRADRLQLVGRIEQRKRQIDAAIAALDEELRARAAELEGRERDLGELREREPVLWGKEEWRAKVAVLEGDVERARASYVERKALKNQLAIDLSAVTVEVQTEEGQGALIERWIEDEKTKRASGGERLRAIEGELGAARPARPLALADAEAAVDAARAARGEIVARVERLLAEVRRVKEDAARIAAREKQLEGERHNWRAVLEGAAIQATEGRGAALRRLAEQRRDAALAHVGDVLGALDQSLASVDSVFVEPVEQALAERDAVASAPSARVRAAAEAIAPIVLELAREVGPKLLAEDAMLGQIQREFCEAAPAACVAAWLAVSPTTAA